MYTKCGHMVQMFVERRAKAFARKWHLFTSVSVTGRRYTMCSQRCRRL